MIQLFRVKLPESSASPGPGLAKDQPRAGTVNFISAVRALRSAQNAGKAIDPFVLADLEYERR